MAADKADLLTPSGAETGRLLRILFGTRQAPRIPFNAADLPQGESQVRLTQDKSSLEIVTENGSHLLKLSPADYSGKAEIEGLCMDMAADLDMDVPPHGFLPMPDGQVAYVIKRFEGLIPLPASDTQDSSLAQAGKAILRSSSQPFLDVTNFFERVVFSFMIGNDHMPLKKWALVTTVQEGKPYSQLAPCFGFAASASSLSDPDTPLSRLDFEKLAESLQINARAAKKIIDRLIKAEGLLLDRILKAGLPEDRQKAFQHLIVSRIRRLSGATMPLPLVSEPVMAPASPVRRLSSTPEWSAAERGHAFDTMGSNLQYWGFMELLASLPDESLSASESGLQEAREKSQIMAFDYCSLRPEGDSYLLKSLFEDTRSQGRLFLDTRIIRIAETIMSMFRFYRTLNAPASSLVRMQFRHGGLQDRVLAMASSDYFPMGERCSSTEEVTTILEERLDKLESRLSDLVYEVIRPLCAAFDGFEPSKTVLVDPLTDHVSRS